MNGKPLSNTELLSQLALLRSEERKTQATFIRYLGEVDRRRLYADEGYASLYKYVTQVLGYSEASALKRIQVARASERYPEILTRLESGGISLNVLSKICPHLELRNTEELLDSCEGLSVRAVEILLAPDSSPELPDKIEPLSQMTSRIQFTARDAFTQKLQIAKDLLRAKYPKAKLEDVFSDALDLLIEAKTPTAIAKRIPKHASRHSKHIPVAVQADAWAKCGGKCSFISESGHRCGETAFLENDHIIPRALGGSSHESGNVRLLCRTHNRFVAEEVYGKKFIADKIVGKPKTLKDEQQVNRALLDLWAAGGWTNAKLASRRGEEQSEGWSPPQS